MLIFSQVFFPLYFILFLISYLQEMERQLAAKEACLPNEPSPDDENVITFLVRMPDGSRRGRRFLKSHRLQVHIICFKWLAVIHSS